jgi:hypothetical protein
MSVTAIFQGTFAMDADSIKAGLNLYAVLQNLEDLVIQDREMADLSKDWDLSIQFLVRNGPQAAIIFKAGSCKVVRGKLPAPTVKLFFVSPAHLNKMMDGNGTPIPLKGFTKLRFLNNDFAKLTDRLEYYLQPTDDLLKDPQYLAMNTRLTLNTAAFALRELGGTDPVSKLALSHMLNGGVMMKIQPEGPAVSIFFQNGTIEAVKGETEHPRACMLMENLQTANDFLNGRLDAFAAIASGKVIIKGQIPMLDAMSIVLDRIPIYLS